MKEKRMKQKRNKEGSQSIEKNNKITKSKEKK